MCLTELCKMTDEYKNIQHGYKVFEYTSHGKKGKRLYPVWLNLDEFNNRRTFPQNKWFKDKSNQIIPVGFRNTYESGFHFFLSLHTAILYANSYNNVCIRKIRIKDLICVGYDYGLLAGVTKQIFITNEEY